MQCSQLNELWDFTRQLMSEAEAAAVREHLQTDCAACASDLLWVKEISELATRDRAPDFKADDIQNLVAWFKAQPLLQTPSARQWIAQLLFDSLRPQELAAVRNMTSVAPASSTGRQLLFHAEGYDIDLRFEAHDDLFSEDLIGQVLAQSGALNEATVVLTRTLEAMKSHRVAHTDEQGLFRFARIPSGFYDVTIRVEDEEINLMQVATAHVI
jgi:hypothetical protein